MMLSWLYNMKILALLALFAGSVIAVQAAMNAQLGVILKNSMIGTSIAFLTSFIFTFVALLLSAKYYPTTGEIKSVPIYLWFSGGLLSAFGVGLFYYLIPKMGVGAMMSFALTGQILVAMLISHFGWFNLPIKQVDFLKLIGAGLLISGLVIINWESTHVS